MLQQKSGKFVMKYNAPNLDGLISFKPSKNRLVIFKIPFERCIVMHLFDEEYIKELQKNNDEVVAEMLAKEAAETAAKKAAKIAIKEAKRHKIATVLNRFLGRCR